MRSKALVVLFFCACVDVSGDDGEGVDDFPRPHGAEIEFNPAASILPFPHSLILSPDTGRVSLPKPCRAETPSARAIRENALNVLDGFGTFKAPQRITMTEPANPASFEGRVVLYQFTSPRGSVDPLTAQPIPVVVRASQTSRFEAGCNEVTVPALNVIPLIPLEENSHYIAAIENGAASEDGEEFLPTVLWSLVRQNDNPVTIENGEVVAERTPLDPVKDRDSLIGIDRLWKAHAQGLRFLDDATGKPRATWTIAYPFKTQSISSPLDASLPGTPAATLPSQKLLGVASITNGDTQAFLTTKLSAETCAAIGCVNVGDVVAGALIAPRYQIDTPNPMPAGKPVPGPWSDPLKPAALPTPAQIPVLAVLPATPAPEGGYPVVVFAHGITRSKGDALAIAPQLAKLGIATVAIDWPNHGARAVQTSVEEPRGCGGTPDPTMAVQCFAPFVSANLVVTRDNFRQAILDATALIKALKGCTGDACGGLDINPQRIGYLGQSLGAILGTSVVAMNPDVRAAVLNAGGGGLVDLVENTDSTAIRCSLVDALIVQGIVEGEVSNPQTGTGTCLGAAWKQQPKYQSFAAIARWILDPGDAINYTARLQGRSVLIQKIARDEVVPNLVTEQQARVLRLPEKPADTAQSGAPAPTTALLGNANPHFVSYTDLPASANPPFPGNTFSHGSLLRPKNANPDGRLGTARLQADALGYLVQILNPPSHE